MSHSPAAAGALVRVAPTAAFVLLWSSGALFARWGLAHASPFAFLVLRFVVALAFLGLLALAGHRLRPQPGSAGRVACSGLLLAGAYPACYFLALDHGLTPGVLATVLGVQPLLTLALTERPLAGRRVAGLLVALTGLSLVVFDSLVQSRFHPLGLGLALAALGAMTWGTLQQKRLDQPPLAVMPLQLAMGLAVCLCLLPFEAVRVDWSWQLAITVAWLGIPISVAGTLLLYRLLARGNVVDVTSLFYLVPAGTALLDALVFGHVLAPLALVGMGAILGGLVMVFRRV